MGGGATTYTSVGCLSEECNRCPHSAPDGTRSAIDIPTHSFSLRPFSFQLIGYAYQPVLFMSRIAELEAQSSLGRKI